MFDDTQTNGTQEPQVTSQQQAPVEDWLVVGERKFDKDSAAKKIEHADTHINKLQQELADLRKQLELDQARKQAEISMQQVKQVEPQQPAVQNTPVTSQGDETALLSLVDKVLTQKATEQSANANLEQAVNAAKTVFGSEYQTKLEQMGKEFGMSKQDIVDLAKTKPQAFNRLFGLNIQPQHKPYVSSTVTSNGFNPQEDPVQSTAKLVLNSTSAKDRTAAIAALLSQTKKR
jgi:hypothetical protein